MRWSVVLCVSLLCSYGHVQAQEDRLRDEIPTPIHASASTALMMLQTIVDGRTMANWDFRTARLHRGTVDIGIGGGTSLGLSVGYSSVPGRFQRLGLASGPSPSCTQDCDVTADFWSAALTIHVGDQPGFHQILEGSVGVNRFSNFRTNSIGEKVGPSGGDTDFALNVGYGLGYTATRRFQITLVQNVGLYVHEKASAMANTNAMYQMLITRLAVRAGLGR